MMKFLLLLLMIKVIFLLASLVAADFESTSCQAECGASFNMNLPCHYLSTISCENKCGASYDRSLVCQCNDACPRYRNCCPDYLALCVSSDDNDCKAFSEVTQELWTNDVDRLTSSDVTLNYQARIQDDDTLEDDSSEKLFSSVDESKLGSEVYTTFLALLDNYDPEKYMAEDVTEEETEEEEKFLDAVLATSVFSVFRDYLLCRDIIQTASELRGVLRTIWFELYARSGNSKVKDTNGFEHVMVGEFKSSGSSSGLHNWLAFYQREKSLPRDQFDYYGHSCDVQPHVVCAAYEWEGRQKRLSTFLVNVSPAYDLALYTLCFLFQPGTCLAQVDGQETRIKTYSKEGHLTTAYVQV